MMSLLGRLMPFFRTGILFRTVAFRFASHALKKHHSVTCKNCMTVSVTGLGSAVKIAFDEVLLRIDAVNQIPHRIWHR